MTHTELDLGNDVAITANNDAKTDTTAIITSTNDDNTTSLDGDTTEDITGKSNDAESKNTEDSSVDNTDDNSSTGELVAGDKIEYENAVYTVSEDGSLLDKDGNVFKASEDVADWLKKQEVDNTESTGEFSINSIQEALGVEITDEDGKPVSFDNTVEGIKAYVDNVVKLKAEEVREGTLNQYFETYPIVKDFVNYLYVNNGDPRGFGDSVRDLSNFKLDKDNIEQQKAIIKLAASEFGNKSLNDSYLNYLADNGALYDEATQQLKALVEADALRKEEMNRQAQEVIRQQEEEAEAYWEDIRNRIQNRKIGKYTLPASINKKVDGRNITLTTDDFFRYLCEPKYKDENGQPITAYLRDEANISRDELLNKELLNAWLMFTGGTFEDIVKMAINEKEVKLLKLKAKENRASRTIRITKNNQKSSINDIVLG